MSSTNEWLQQRIDHYWAHKNDTCEAIEDFDDLGKLGQGFTSADPLEEVDIGDGTVPRLTFVNKIEDWSIRELVDGRSLVMSNWQHGVDWLLAEYCRCRLRLD
jgi:hypothetical protein